MGKYWQWYMERKGYQEFVRYAHLVTHTAVAGCKVWIDLLA